MIETFRELLRILFRALDAKHGLAQKFGLSEGKFLDSVFRHVPGDRRPGARP